jgi:hypothetical protein
VDKIGKFSTACGMLKSIPQAWPVFHRVFHRVFHKKQGVFHRVNMASYLFISKLIFHRVVFAKDAEIHISKQLQP